GAAYNNTMKSTRDVNLDAYTLSLVTAKEDVLNPRSSTNWALFAYDGVTNRLRLSDSGVGGVLELASKLHPRRPLYGLCRVEQPGPALSHIVMIIWEVHIFLPARSLEEVTEERICMVACKVTRLMDNVRARPPISRQDAGEELVGTNYKRTIASAEILQTHRERFWAQAEREEEERKEEERRRAVEDRRQRERERLEQERREAERREKRMKEREKKIQEQRQKYSAFRRLQAQAEAERHKWEQLKWAQQQREYEQEAMRARHTHSESVEKASEAAALASQRRSNPREFFRQLSQSSAAAANPKSPTVSPLTARGSYRKSHSSLTDAFLFNMSASATTTSPCRQKVVSPFFPSAPPPWSHTVVLPNMPTELSPSPSVDSPVLTPFTSLQSPTRRSPTLQAPPPPCSQTVVSANNQIPKGDSHLRQSSSSAVHQQPERSTAAPTLDVSPSPTSIHTQLSLTAVVESLTFYPPLPQPTAYFEMDIHCSDQSEHEILPRPYPPTAPHVPLSPGHHPGPPPPIPQPDRQTSRPQVHINIRPLSSISPSWSLSTVSPTSTDGHTSKDGQTSTDGCSSKDGQTSTDGCSSKDGQTSTVGHTSTDGHTCLPTMPCAPPVPQAPLRPLPALSAPCQTLRDLEPVRELSAQVSIISTLEEDEVGEREEEDGEDEVTSEEEAEGGVREGKDGGITEEIETERRENEVEEVKSKEVGERDERGGERDEEERWRKEGVLDPWVTAQTSVTSALEEEEDEEDAEDKRKEEATDEKRGEENEADKQRDEEAVEREQKMDNKVDEVERKEVGERDEGTGEEVEKGEVKEEKRQEATEKTNREVGEYDQHGPGSKSETETEGDLDTQVGEREDTDENMKSGDQERIRREEDGPDKWPSKKGKQDEGRLGGVCRESELGGEVMGRKKSKSEAAGTGKMSVEMKKAKLSEQKSETGVDEDRQAEEGEEADDGMGDHRGRGREEAQKRRRNVEREAESHGMSEPELNGDENRAEPDIKQEVLTTQQQRDGAKPSEYSGDDRLEQSESGQQDGQLRPAGGEDWMRNVSEERKETEEVWALEAELCRVCPGTILQSYTSPDSLPDIQASPDTGSDTSDALSCQGCGIWTCDSNDQSTPSGGCNENAKTSNMDYDSTHLSPDFHNTLPTKEVESELSISRHPEQSLSGDFTENMAEAILETSIDPSTAISDKEKYPVCSSNSSLDTADTITPMGLGVPAGDETQETVSETDQIMDYLKKEREEIEVEEHEWAEDESDSKELECEPAEWYTAELKPHPSCASENRNGTSPEEEDLEAVNHIPENTAQHTPRPEPDQAEEASDLETFTAPNNEMSSNEEGQEHTGVGTPDSIEEATVHASLLSASDMNVNVTDSDYQRCSQ
ncbi:hypothetical protein P4O66_016940, partial [Electrophorus voltai]